MSTPTDSKSVPGMPKYQRLALQIRERITSGELQPGHRLPTFVEMRNRYGATATTVMRMYEMLEREGLITRTHGSGVYVAPPRAAKKTGTIGFVISTSLQHHPYYVHLLEGVRREAELAGVEVLLLSEKSAIRWEKIDGVIFQVTTNEYLHELTTLPGVPRVALVYAHPHLDSAVADDRVGVLQAMEHLRALGHRRIGFLTQEIVPDAISQQRLTAYRDALHSWGVELQPTWIRCLHEPDKTGRTWEQTGYDDMRQWLAEDWSTLGCTALLAHNDGAAVGVVAALQDAGLRVPQDVSVVGFDGTEIAQFHRPRLTTVKVPLKEIGAQGFELLIRQVNRPVGEIHEDRLPQRLSLPTQLIIGQSTAPVAVRNPERRRNGLR